MRTLLGFDLQLFAEEKTEQPTERKRRRARERGNVTRSRELSSAVILMGAFLAVRFLFPYIGNSALLLARYCLDGSFFAGDLRSVGELAFLTLIKSTLPVLLITAGFALLVNFVQVGALFTTEPLSPKLSRINPALGFARIFSRRSLVELFKAVIKVGVIGYVLYLTLRQEISALRAVPFMEVKGAAGYFGTVITSLTFRSGIVLLGLSLIDYAYERYEYEQSLRMSRRELRDEFKETEGDPEVKAWLKRQAEQILKERMIARVKTADVVVTNPTHLAVALKYEAGRMSAPVVVARGKGLLAEQLKKKAREYNIPIVQNPPLARALYSSVDLDQPIPPELYQAVAEVLAFVYRLRERRRNRNA